MPNNMPKHCRDNGGAGAVTPSPPIMNIGRPQGVHRATSLAWGVWELLMVRVVQGWGFSGVVRYLSDAHRRQRCTKFTIPGKKI
jgi:hypothetical protein